MANSEPARQRLLELRQALLVLHKTLLDSERTAYELVHGRIQGPGAFLQLLINDSWFAWLRPITTLVVEIDETLAAKNPPATERNLELLIDNTKALLSPSLDEDSFWQRYSIALKRDPGVALQHDQMEKYFS